MSVLGGHRFHVCLLLLVLYTGRSGARLVRRSLLDVDPQYGVCNDGSEAVYYHSPGTPDVPEDSYSQFIIYLEGGGFCDTPEAC